jgi:ribosome biogenesis GTPase
MTYDLSSLGWDDAFAAAYAPLDRSDTAAARVLRTDLGVCTVMGADGVGRASLAGSVLLGAARDPAGLPCAGDWVVVRRWPDRRYTVEVVLPRRSVLTGPPAGQEQAAPQPAGPGPAGQRRISLAANVDTVAVVEPWQPAPDVDRITRLLDAVRQSGARPVIVLSTAETSTTGRRAARPAAVGAPDTAALMRRLAHVAPGVAVLVIGAHDSNGLDALRELVAPGRTLALLGGAGSGRSALVDALAGATTMPARTITPAPAAGRPDGRPAARPAVVPVPGGGAVVDVPAAEGDEQSFRAPGRLAAVAGSGDARRRPRR